MSILSILTVTLNAEHCINDLIKSLRQQTDMKFEWVVVDGKSTDNTLEILSNVDDIKIKVISEADFGIYDALNEAIKRCDGHYYLVLGADDTLYPRAVEEFKKAASSKPDIVTAPIDINGHIINPGRGPVWLKGHGHYISGHAVGSMIRKSLHEEFGYYSNKYPISADQHFILRACNRKGIKVKVIDYVSGSFGDGGLS